MKAKLYSRSETYSFESGEWFNISNFKLLDAEESRFSASFECYIVAYRKKCKFIIDIISLYHVKNGIWDEQDGEYYQKGNLSQVSIYGNADYSTTIYCKVVEVDNPEKLVDSHILSSVNIQFPDISSAESFVLSINKIQGERYDNTPWLRTKKENEQYHGQTSKEIYNLLVKNFSDYEISSEQVHSNREFAKSDNFRVKYDHPYLVISHTDSRQFDFHDGFKYGTTTIKIPISDARFENGVDIFGHDKEQMQFSSESGIEISHNGKKTIEYSYALYSSEIVCKRILSNLRAFKSKISSEGFNGKYGYSSSSQGTKPKSETKNMLNKYEQ